MNTVSTFGTAGAVTPPPSCNPLTVDAGPDQNVVLGAPINLAGTVLDPGIREDQRLAVLWSAVGPGIATFSNAAAVNTSVTLSVPGAYLFTLTAYTDPCSPVSDSLQLALNGPPVVDAGPNQVVANGASTLLAGTVTDDGLPMAGALSFSWSQVSGPYTARFGNIRSLTSTISFPQVGIYVLRLTATDGQLSASDTVTIASNGPPVVNAGPDQLIPFPGGATLAGSVTDDGFSGSPVSHLWTQTAGPGTAVFANASSLNTTVSFPVSGVYTFTLTASNATLSALDSVTITANAAPLVNAGPDQRVVFGGTITLQGTATDDGYPLPPAFTHVWTKTSGPGTATFSNAGSLTPTVVLSDPGTYVLLLTASDGNRSSSDSMSLNAITAPIVSAGPDQVIVSGTSASLSGSIAGIGILTQGWTATGAGTVAFSNANSASTSATFSAPGTYILTLSAATQYLTGSDSLVVIVERALIVSAGSDAPVIHGASYMLAGAVSGGGAGRVYGWTQTSGPGTATFSNAAGLDSSVSFSSDGVYVLRLSAHDNVQANVFDEATLTVYPILSVNAGPDFNNVLGQPSTLAGTLAGGSGNATIAWTVVSGPGSVTFSNPATLNSAATFSTAGTYILRLAAADVTSGQNTSDTVSVDCATHPAGGICSVALNSAGGDEGYVNNFPIDLGGFTIYVIFNPYSVEDRLVISDETDTLLDTGFIGGSYVIAYAAVAVPLAARNVHVQVFPGTDTLWTLQITCEPPMPLYSGPTTFSATQYQGNTFDLTGYFTNADPLNCHLESSDLPTGLGFNTSPGQLFTIVGIPSPSLPTGVPIPFHFTCVTPIATSAPVSATLTITAAPQPYPRVAFRWKWDATSQGSSSTSLLIDLTPTQADSANPIDFFIIDWGDGNQDYPDTATALASDQSHTYAEQGSYVVTVGTFTENSSQTSAAGTITIPHTPYTGYVNVP